MIENLPLFGTLLVRRLVAVEVDRVLLDLEAISRHPVPGHLRRPSCSRRHLDMIGPARYPLFENRGRDFIGLGQCELIRLYLLRPGWKPAKLESWHARRIMTEMSICRLSDEVAEPLRRGGYPASVIPPLESRAPFRLARSRSRQEISLRRIFVPAAVERSPGREAGRLRNRAGSPRALRGFLDHPHLDFDEWRKHEYRTLTRMPLTAVQKSSST